MVMTVASHFSGSHQNLSIQVKFFGREKKKRFRLYVGLEFKISLFLLLFSLFLLLFMGSTYYFN